MRIDFVDEDGEFVTAALSTEEMLRCMADDALYPRWTPSPEFVEALHEHD